MLQATSANWHALNHMMLMWIAAKLRHLVIVANSMLRCPPGVHGIFEVVSRRLKCRWVCRERIERVLSLAWLEAVLDAVAPAGSVGPDTKLRTSGTALLALMCTPTTARRMLHVTAPHPMTVWWSLLSRWRSHCCGCISVSDHWQSSKAHGGRMLHSTDTLYETSVN